VEIQKLVLNTVTEQYLNKQLEKPRSYFLENAGKYVNIIVDNKFKSIEREKSIEIISMIDYYNNLSKEINISYNKNEEMIWKKKRSQLVRISKRNDPEIKAKNILKSISSFKYICKSTYSSASKYLTSCILYPYHIFTSYVWEKTGDEKILKWLKKIDQYPLDLKRKIRKTYSNMKIIENIEEEMTEKIRDLEKIKLLKKFENKSKEDVIRDFIDLKDYVELIELK